MDHMHYYRIFVSMTTPVHHPYAILNCRSQSEGDCQQVLLVQVDERAPSECNCLVLSPWMLDGRSKTIRVEFVKNVFVARMADARFQPHSRHCARCGCTTSWMYLRAVHMLSQLECSKWPATYELPVTVENYGTSKTYVLPSEAAKLAGTIIIRLVSKPDEQELVDRFLTACHIEEEQGLVDRALAVRHLDEEQELMDRFRTACQVGEVVPSLTLQPNRACIHRLRPRRHVARMEFADHMRDPTESEAEEMEVRRARRASPVRQPIMRSRRF
ncbi:hypothetical protein BDY19DRAFT_922088 [Irpex rosettiformis]|uniref:Uncharacterized protein n=1 Tax=Irpex rosettiformis TaxID=378272 RepID=A0ACB8UFL0_9APHY|nr:hypothetical protein BDY19DRAFT_922088 [Irpex rosettiformis]